MKSKYQVGDLKLPKGIIERFENNTWQKPSSFDKLEQLILEKNPFELEAENLKKEVKDFELYQLGLIQSETKYLKEWEDTDAHIMFLGKEDPINSPGCILPEKSLFFADFGIGSDTPFALDYSENLIAPSVLLIYWGENANVDNRWIKIANSFQEFEKAVW
jgi:hypothetical protein